LVIVVVGFSPIDYIINTEVIMVLNSSLAIVTIVVLLMVLHTPIYVKSNTKHYSNSMEVGKDTLLHMLGSMYYINRIL